MHCPKHAGNKFINAVAFCNKRYKSRYSAFIVSDVAKMGKDQLLKLVNLVLKGHQVGDGFVAFIWVVNGF